MDESMQRTLKNVLLGAIGVLVLAALVGAAYFYLFVYKSTPPISQTSTVPASESSATSQQEVAQALVKAEASSSPQKIESDQAAVEAKLQKSPPPQSQVTSDQREVQAALSEQ